MQFFSSSSRKRRFAAGFASLSAVILLVASLAACGSSSSGSGSTGGTVNLTYWSWITGISNVVARFNQTHPGIHVNVVDVGAGTAEYNKLFTAVKANNEPDLAMIEFDILPTFETTGALLDLSPYGVNAVKDQFVPWAWNLVTLGSAVYAVPGDTAPMALYYRADLFTKYHLPVPVTISRYEGTIHAFVNMAATGIEKGKQALAEAAAALRTAFHPLPTSE